jgi:hypothetical protein
MAKVAKKSDPKKPIRIKMVKVGSAPDKSKDGVELGFKKGSETRTYKKQTANTGDSRYGKEDKTKDAPGFVKDAQKKGQDFAYKNNLKYRAGETTTVKKPDQFSAKIKVTPDVRPLKIMMSKSGASQDKVKGKTNMPNKRLPPTVSWLKQQKKHERGH